MPWTVYNSNGQILQGSATLADDSVTSAKIVDGAIVNADINASAAIAFTKMANLTTARALVSDGSGDVSVSAVTSTEIGYLDGVTSAIQTQLNAAGGAVTREGGDTTESTTTSTSASDLHSTTSLSIGTTTGFDMVVATRKTSGATAGFGCGTKLNSTVTAEANATGGHVFLPTNNSTNAAEDRWGHLESGIRITNYVRGIISIGNGYTATAQTAGGRPQVDADMPIATLTSITVRGLCASSSITGGIDEMHVYTRVIS